MSGPPEDPIQREIWTGLAQFGYDPDSGEGGPGLDIAEGGLRLTQVPSIVESLISSFEEWEYLFVYAGPSPTPDSSYEFANFVVEWSEEAEAWRPKDAPSPLFQKYNARISEEHPVVDATELPDKTVTPLDRTVTGISRKAVPQMVESFASPLEETELEIRFSLKPDMVGKYYEISYEVIQWVGNRDDGEWKSIRF